MNALEYIKRWCAQDQSALSGRQVADAVIRMCDDALQDAGRPTPREADDFPACLCPADGISFYCPIHGAVATGRGLR